MSEEARAGRSGVRRGIARPAVIAVIAAALLAAYAWWAVELPAFSAAASAAVVLPGVAVAALAGVGIGIRRRDRPPPPVTAAGVGRWALVAALAAGWQIAAYLQHPRDDHPTLSSLTNAALDSQAARAAAFVAWLAVTAALARR
jgi:hypothetical protein